MIADQVTPTHDLTDDFRMLPFPRIAVAEALALHEEDRLDAEVVEHVQETRRVPARRTVIECEENRAVLAAATNREATREPQACNVLVGDRHHLGHFRPWLGVHRLDDGGWGVTNRRRRDRDRRSADLGSARERAAGDQRKGAAAQSNLPRDPGHLECDRTEARAADARKPQDLDRSAVATGDRIEYPRAPYGQ